jgi:hypothetical protein
MAWTYQVEYRLGTRGGRVTRTYGGVRALLAIAFDLVLGLVFGAIGLVFRAIGWAGWLVYRAIRWTGWLVWNLLRLVVIAIRDILLTLGRFVTAVVMLPWRSSRPAPGRLPAKSRWVAFDDL